MPQRGSASFLRNGRLRITSLPVATQTSLSNLNGAVGLADEALLPVYLHSVPMAIGKKYLFTLLVKGGRRRGRDWSCSAPHTTGMFCSPT